MKLLEINEQLSKIYSIVEESVIGKMDTRDRIEEDHITSEIFSQLESKLSQNINEVDIRCRQFPGRGRNSEESIIGADGSIVFTLETPSIYVRKFILLQSKNFSSKKFSADSIKQKDKMLRITPDSFFLIYGKSSLDFYSAFLINSSSKVNELPKKGFSEFLLDMSNCFIGDHFVDFPPVDFIRPWRHYPYFEYGIPYLAKNNLELTVKLKDEK